MEQKFTNFVIALTTIVLASLLFLGVQAKNQGTSLNAVVEHSTPWEVAQSNNLPTIVEFYADWCTTCQSMAADTRGLEEEFIDRVNFVMLDVDNSRWLPELRQFKVDGIPHFIFLSQKKEVLGEAIGFVPRDIMAENLEALTEGKDLPHTNITSDQKSFFSSPLAPDQTNPRSHS